MSVSDLYAACCDGKLHIVQQLLPTLTRKEINRIEPVVGSTSLHAACFYNHPKIVKLLLDYGASPKIKNKYGCVPYGEAQTEEVKQLFHRSFDDAQKRFSAAIPVEKEIEYTSIKYGEYGWRCKCYITNNDIDKGIDGIMADKRFEDAISTNKIDNLLAEARETKDPELLIQIYTVGTGFCHVINQVLAEYPVFQEDTKEEANLYSFIGVFLRHDALIQHRYVGKCFRGMKLSEEDFDKNYRIGQKLLIKPFISTSKRREIAENFATKTNISSCPLSLICIITIPERTRSFDDNVVLDISSISDYREEEEVLILPYTSLQIGNIRHLPSGLIEVEMGWYSYRQHKSYF